MLQSLGTLFILLAFEQFLAGDDDVAALLVQLDDRNFDGLALHAIQVADRAQVNLRAGQERVRAMDIDREAALDAVDDDCLDRLLLVVGLLDFFPGMDALRLLEGEVDVAFLGLALGAHDLDLVAGLELGLALVIEHFSQRQHAFRLGADIDDHVSAGEFRTVPLMTLSSLTASSASVVKVSSAEAKSSAGAAFSAAWAGCGAAASLADSLVWAG